MERLDKFHFNLTHNHSINWIHLYIWTIQCLILNRCKKKLNLLMKRKRQLYELLSVNLFYSETSHKYATTNNRPFDIIITINMCFTFPRFLLWLENKIIILSDSEKNLSLRVKNIDVIEKRLSTYEVHCMI